MRCSFGVIQNYIALKLNEFSCGKQHSFGVIQNYIALKLVQALLNAGFSFGVIQNYIALKPQMQNFFQICAKSVS